MIQIDFLLKKLVTFLNPFSPFSTPISRGDAPFSCPSPLAAEKTQINQYKLRSPAPPSRIKRESPSFFGYHYFKMVVSNPMYGGGMSIRKKLLASSLASTWLEMLFFGGVATSKFCQSRLVCIFLMMLIDFFCSGHRRLYADSSSVDLEQWSPWCAGYCSRSGYIIQNVFCI